MSARCRGPRLRELLDKRVTGYFNWRRGRRAAHDMDILGDARRRHPRRRRPTTSPARATSATSACRANGRRARLPRGARPARDGQLRAGQPRRLRARARSRGCSPKSRPGRAATTAPCAASPMCAGAGRRPRRPVLGDPDAAVRRQRQGRRQAARGGRAAARRRSAGEKLFRVVMIHHPPHAGGAPAGRNLTDARALRGDDRARRRRARHPRPQPCRLDRLVWGRRARAGDRRALGLGARRHAHAQRRLLSLLIEADEGGFALKAELHGLKADGSVGCLSVTELSQ